MISEENLNKLYRDVLEDTQLTTKELNGLGFNSKDLNDLIEQGSLTRVKRGLYSLKSVDGLFHYGKKLIMQKQYDKASQCFQKCFEIDSTHKGVCFQLFLRCIQDRDYKKAFEYFDVFYMSENEFYNADSNFYLYLLSMITEIPENHREYAKFLKLEDFRVDFKDKRYADVSKQNKIRLSAFNQRFILAVKQLNETVQEKGNLSVQDLVIKTLLSQAIEVQTQNRNNVINLIKQKRYEDVITLYEKMASSHRLSLSNSYTFILTKELLDIIHSKNIPERQVFSTENVFEAIDGKNFELALDLTIARNQKSNVGKDDNAIYLLLDAIVNKCRELNGNISQESKMVTSTKIEGAIKPSEEKRSAETGQITKTTFADIVKFLMNGDLDNSFRTLRTYLANINKSDYEFLIIDLIKMSLLEKDIAFTKPMTTLALISRDNYVFDISTYIQEFYINLSQNKFEEARIYLDIVSKGNKLGQDCVIADCLYQILEASEKMLNYKKNSVTLNTVDEALENSKKTANSNSCQEASYEKPQKEPLVGEEPIKQELQGQDDREATPKEEIAQETRDAEKEFMDKKHEELLNDKGIILLGHMNDDKIDRIFDMVSDYSDMVAFVIGEGREEQVVLRYKPIIDEYVDSKSLIEMGNQAYKQGNYDECIRNYLQLLQLFESPRSNIYSKLGLAYLKKKQIPLAIDYLTIATYLAKKENIDLDFSDLLANLKGDIPLENRKPYFRMTQKDFNYSDVDNYYGVSDFEKINAYIAESGLDVESAGEQLGLSLEEIDIIRLIYAREFYAQGNYDKGDLFLRAVEMSKNKTGKTMKRLNEIRKNKIFYQNRKRDSSVKLKLSLAPKKKK